jgi:hypothetical protein
LKILLLLDVDGKRLITDLSNYNKMAVVVVRGERRKRTTTDGPRRRQNNRTTDSSSRIIGGHAKVRKIK